MKIKLILNYELSPEFQLHVHFESCDDETYQL